MYLTDSDYDILIKDEILLRIIDDNPDIRMEGELYAEKVMSSYLNKRYDVVEIFSKTGNDRDRDILVMYIDITLHLLLSRINPDQIPQFRVDRYEAAMRWLREVASGDISPILPVLPTEEIKKSIVVRSQEKKQFDF